MTGIKILQSRVKHLNDLSRREFILLGLDTSLTSYGYRHYTLRLIKTPFKSDVIFTVLRAKTALLIVESMIDFFLADKENNPLLYVFA